MRQPGGILLVSCYELGHQPLSLASPLAYLRRGGFSPAAVDSSVEPLTDEKIASAALVAISVPMHTAMRLGIRIAARVRAVNPQAHICFYGLYAVLNSSLLFDEYADSVIGGEYEEPLLQLARALEQGIPPAEVTAVSTRHRLAGPHLARLSFAVPERDSLPPVEKYAHLELDGTAFPAGYVETSRGCLHTCTHCPITPVYGGRFFILPLDVVLQDIRNQVRQGVRHITFGDPDFLNGPGHSMKVLRAMHAEFPDLTFDATMKIEHILEHAALLPELASLGCAFVLSAVESLSDAVLRHLKKQHTRADVVRAIELTRAAGVPLRPSLLPFTPWESLEGYLELIDFWEEQGLVTHVDPVQFTIRLLVPPGSALEANLSSDGLLGPLNADALTYAWRHPDPRMDALQRDAARLVEADAAAGEDPIRTFYKLRDAAYAAAGRTARGPAILTAAPVPRLSESWFC